MRHRAWVPAFFLSLLLAAAPLTVEASGPQRDQPHAMGFLADLWQALWSLFSPLPLVERLGPEMDPGGIPSTGDHLGPEMDPGGLPADPAA